MAISPNNTPAVLSPAKLAHVAIRTNNLATMKAFYMTFLGARDHFSNEALSFLTYDEEHHRIALIGRPDAANKTKNSSGLEHISFTFNNLTELLTAYRQRKELGVNPVFCIHHGPTISLYYRDPDGNILETQIDTMTNEEADAFVLSAEFAANPFGIEIDPEEFLQRLENGTDERDLIPRQEGIPAEWPAVFG